MARKLAFTSASAQGGRSHQEDRWVACELPPSPGGRLFSVMDGHGGTAAVSQWLADHLADSFVDIFSQQKRTGNSFFDDLLKVLHEGTKSQASGSTLSLVYVPDEGSTAWVAVLGDSPVVIETPGNPVFISPSHNVRSNRKEREAALARGGGYEPEGYLSRPGSDYWLQMARSLGDADLDPVLDRTPDVFKIPLAPGSVILVASDGLLDPSHDDASGVARHVMELVRKGADADALVQDAISRRTGDNATAILVRIG